jgi:hypothetical protein
MERRASERIPINLYVRFYCNKMWHTGIVTNLSKSGMGIDTRKRFPLKSKFEIIIASQEATMKVPVTVSRLMENGDPFCGMGTKIVEHPANYIRLIDNARSAYCVLKFPSSNF